MEPLKRMKMRVTTKRPRTQPDVHREKHPSALPRTLDANQSSRHRSHKARYIISPPPHFIFIIIFTTQLHTSSSFPHAS